MNSILKQKVKTLTLQFLNGTGGYNYKKFVVIARSRTGSNYLISLLNSHTNVQALGEEFNNLNDDSTQDIYNRIFCRKPYFINLVGFKLFYNHPTDSVDKSIWKILKEDKSIKIIHLTRENLLRAILSRKIASKTGKWVEKSTVNHTYVDNKRVYLNDKECFNAFEKIKEFENKTNETFSNHSMFKITYERLVAEEKSKLELQNFLELKPQKLLTQLKRQNSEDLKSLVINYKDLEKKISNSKWKYLLELQ